MKLGFYYHVPCFLAEDGRIGMPSYQGIFIDSIACENERVYCFLHVQENRDFIDYWISSSNVEVVSLNQDAPAYVKTLFPWRFVTKRVKQKINDCDLILIKGPSPLLPYFQRFVPLKKKVFFFVGSYNIKLKTLHFSLLKSIIVKLLLWHIDSKTIKVVRDNSIIVNSRELFNRYKSTTKKIFEIKTTTLTDEWFIEKRDFIVEKPLKLLCVGRLEESKGLLDVIDALGILSDEGLDCNLIIVGKEEKGREGFTRQLIKKAKELNVENRIILKGQLDRDHLISCYRSCNVFIMPSYYEGFPRVIWEAMASLMPVISTNVGSIPFFIKDQSDVLIINPHSPNEIADAVKLLISNPSFAKDLIENARVKANENTTGLQAKRLMEVLSSIQR